jgi:hypothetical protein
MTMTRLLQVSAVAVATAVAAPAAAQFEYENDTGGSANFYGQFNPAYTSVDDGVETTDTFVDNSHSNSRFGFNVFQELEGGSLVRFRFETGLGFRQSGDVSQVNKGKLTSWNRTDLRWVDLQLRTANYGRFYAGQGAMSGDGAGQFDLSGTDLANYVASSADTAGSFFFRDAAGDLSNVTVGDVLSDFDPSRRGRVRYDTPDFNGFTFSVSYGKNILSENDTRTDYYASTALWYENVFDNGVEFEAGVGYEQRNRITRATDASSKQDNVFGSASVLLPSGVNFTGAFGFRDADGQDFTSKYIYVKAGYIANVLAVGSTAVGIDYFAGSDAEVAGDSSGSWGFGVVQSIEDYGLDVYLGYRNYTYDQPAADFQDLTSWLFGTRFRF